MHTMPIDNCPHTFQALATEVLPGYFALLQAAIAKPIPASALSTMKSASRAALSAVARQSDFPGCYVFIDGTKPIYVGISRTVVRRLVQHLSTDTHFSASLVYRMASEDYPHEMKRDQAMKDVQFRNVFFRVQERLQAMSFAFIEIPNDLELYTFEVYAAMSLDTDTWNTFRTH